MDRWIFLRDQKFYGPLATNLGSDNFTMHELTRIMRQPEDLSFAELLNRLREDRQTSAHIVKYVKMDSSPLEQTLLHIYFLPTNLLTTLTITSSNSVLITK